MAPPPARTWTIGDLAAASGLTVRTLHHYEALGLLAPRRTEGNHRVYDADDVSRLYRIRALRELGVPLAEIGGALEGHDLRPLLRAQLARVEAEVARLADQRARLSSLAGSAAGSPEALLATMEAMSRLSAHVARRRARGTREVEARWRALGASLRERLDAGDAPDAPAVAAIAREVRDATAAFAGQDPDVLGALAQVRRHAPPTGLAGWDPVLFRYLDDALSSLEPPC